jgi:phosphatidylethanolamine-binding protein (PEBP) family uncharacterized protein
MTYGGIPVEFAEGDLEVGGVGDVERLEMPDAINDPFYYSGGSDEDQMWMWSRDSSYDELNEESQRAAAIIGSGSALVLVVVLAVVISGLTSLLGIETGKKFSVRSDWTNGGNIPLRYGCAAAGGEDAAQSIPLAYSHVPPGTVSLVVLVANPGAIKATGHDPVHWFVTDIPVGRGGAVAVGDKSEWNIAANASHSAAALLPRGAVQRANGRYGSGAWFAPCALEDGAPSLYIVYVYAVDAKPEIGNFRDARQIMNRFSGVPTAKIAGYYGHAAEVAPADVKEQAARFGLATARLGAGFGPL